MKGFVDIGRGDVEGGGYVELLGTGLAVKGEFHCSDCGYGVIVSKELPICPMCGGRSWEQSSWSPFGRSEVANRLA